jgi:hypothetical protein
MEVNEMYAIHPDRRPVLGAVLALMLAFVLATDPLAPPALPREAR